RGAQHVAGGVEHHVRGGQDRQHLGGRLGDHRVQRSRTGAAATVRAGEGQRRSDTDHQTDRAGEHEERRQGHSYSVGQQEPPPVASRGRRGRAAHEFTPGTPPVHGASSPVHPALGACGGPGTTGPRRTPMREAYQSDLRHIVDDLVDMSEMVGTALEDATTALLEGDLALAERVVTADPHLDSRQLELDAKTVELLARQSPVATDLRLLVASLRMSSSLERMGDLAAHVALVARRAHPDRAVPARHREQVARMSELGLTALRAAAQVIRTRDLALGAQVEKQDDELDELMLTISREISGSDEDSYTNAEVIDLTLLIRFYERIGDH